MPEDPVPPSAQPPPPFPTTPPPPGAPDENQARTWNMLCHLSALAGLAVPFGNVLGPLVVWQLKKHEYPSVEAHGRAAVNFQLTVLIAVFVGAVAAVLLSVICIGFLLFFAVAGIGLCGVIFAIIAGIKANDGLEYNYPYSFKLV